MPDCAGEALAAGTPDSGTGITMSASTGAWRRAPRPCAGGRACTLLAVELRVGAGEVDELEQAELRGRARRSGSTRTPEASITTISPGSTSRTKCAPTMSSAAVSLGEHPAALEPAEHSGRKPCGSRTPMQVRLVHQHERERALEAGQHLDRARARGRGRRERSASSAYSLDEQLGRSSVAVGGDGCRAACRARRRAPRCW